ELQVARLPPAPIARHNSPPKEHGKNPQQVQPGQIMQSNFRHTEKPNRLDERLGNRIIGVSRLSQPTKRKIMSYSRATSRRVPGNRTTAISLPAHCQASERPQAKAEAAQR